MKKFNERKKFKKEKNKIGNILKGKKLKEKKLVVGVLSAAPLCTIYGATIENYFIWRWWSCKHIPCF